LKNKEDIFLSVLEENKRIIYKIANSYCPYPEDRSDLVQEMIIQLWSSFESYNSSYKLSTWMYRIALNTAISFYRKAKLRKGKMANLSEAIQNKMEAPEAYTADPKIKILNTFISELKEFDKAIILLYLDGQSQKEMSEILGISPTNAGTKINRIKNLLKKKFDKIENYD